MTVFGGLGAGAGNTATEMLTAVLERANIPIGIDLFGIMDTATQVLQPIISSLGVTLPKTQDAMMLGYGVYSSFMLHAAVPPSVSAWTTVRLLSPRANGALWVVRRIGCTA